MAIPLLETVNNTAIISIDSLCYSRHPYVRAYLCTYSCVKRKLQALLVQTRADDTSIFDQALTGNLIDFTENELTLRKAFSYPPYGTIIKITLRGKQGEVAPEMGRLKTFLANYAPIVPGTMSREPARHCLSLKGSSQAMAGGPKNIFRMHMILKLAKDVWPENDLLAKLCALPMQFSIEVNPDHLL